MAAAGSAPPAPAPMPGADIRAFVLDDGRHAAAPYAFAHPCTAADFETSADQLISSGCDTLIWLAGVEGGNAIYDSAVAPLWGSNVTRWSHTVWYRGWRNLQSLIEQGGDPLAILCDRCHAKGVLMVAGSWASFLGNTRELAGGLGRTSDWVFDHTTDYACGDRAPPPAQPAGPGATGVTAVDPLRFSWLHQAVRARRFAEFEELLRRYTTDGVEVNFVDLAPLCRFDEVGALAPLVTQWLRELRAVADGAAAAQRRRKRVLARVPADPAAWAALGYDVAGWVREGLVDSLVCTSGQTESTMEQNLNLGPAVALCAAAGGGGGCQVLGSISANLLKQGLQYARGPDIHAAAAACYAQGADGVGLGNAWWGPHGWPWLRDEVRARVRACLSELIIIFERAQCNAIPTLTAVSLRVYI
eukprot:SAG22_NODE_283_length_13027_cov_25.568535_7_plen_416_part_00